MATNLGLDLKNGAAGLMAALLRAYSRQLLDELEEDDTPVIAIVLGAKMRLGKPCSVGLVCCTASSDFGLDFLTLFACLLWLTLFACLLWVDLVCFPGMPVTTCIGLL
jgi:hypothetical protein